VYGGDTNNQASTSSTLTQTVHGVSPPPAPSPPSGPSVPGAPTGTSALAADGQATVSCTPPADNGGAAITSYTATASPSGAQASSSSCPITITGLTDGTSYTFIVTATSSAGTSAGSAASNAVTPTDTHAPTAPGGLTGRLGGGALIVSWRASSDNVGVDHYELYLNGTPILRIGGAQTQARTRAFDRNGQGVYTMRAFDAAGNQSDAQGSVTVDPVKRPASAPKTVPRWAWKLLAWQENGRHGTQPKTPHPLPHWYAGWAAWREHPFRLAT
jgi:hypothetical protein